MTRIQTLPFWESIAVTLRDIVETMPCEFDEVKEILDATGNPDDTDYGTRTADTSFFAGSGGDNQLCTALCAAGWVYVWAEANYWYVMRHPLSGDVLTYTEGDVQRGDTTGRAL